MGGKSDSNKRNTEFKGCVKRKVILSIKNRPDIGAIFCFSKFKKKQDHSFSNLLTTRKFPVNPHFERYEPTKIEIDILRILADNPKESLIDIGRKLSIDRNTVKKRITNLIGKKVILNFGGIPNLSKQGFVTYYLLVRVEQETPLEILKKPFAKLQNIFYAGRMIGDYDMILYLNARNPQELNSSIEFFKSETSEFGSLEFRICLGFRI